MDYDEHVEAGEQCFGSRFCWPGVACAFANWPCIGKLFFFPNLSLLVAQSSIYIYIYFFFLVVCPSTTAQNMDEEGSPPPPSWKTEIQGLFASLKQDLRQEIEAKFRVLDGPESNEDESSNGDEESTEVSPTLTSCLADYLGDAPKSSFDNLAEEFSTADKTSAPVNAKLATMIEERIKDNLPKAKLEQLVEKYSRPENCKLLVSPKVNRAIWNQLSPSTKSSDRANKLSRKLSSKRSSPSGYQPYNAQHRQRSSSFSRRGKPYCTRPFLGEKSSYSKKVGARPSTSHSRRETNR